MNKLPLLAGGAALLLSVAVPETRAYDSDPGYTNPRANSTGATVYYRPTLRYYTKDYTVAYGFVPWDKRAARLKPVVTDGRFTLSEAQVASFGSRSPRVTYTKRKQPVSRIAAPRPVLKTAPAEQVVSAAPAIETTASAEASSAQ